jgi:hypothetical protein
MPGEVSVPGQAHPERQGHPEAPEGSRPAVTPSTRTQTHCLGHHFPRHAQHFQSGIHLLLPI